MQTVIVIDYGSQETQLIARRVREAGVYSEILPCTAPLDKVKQAAPAAIILSDGPASPVSVDEADAPKLQMGLLELGVPVLGIGYGMQLLAHNFGGELAHHYKQDKHDKQDKQAQHESGQIPQVSLKFSAPSPLWDGLTADKELAVCMSHGGKVSALPSGFTAIASAEALPVAAMADDKRKIYGLQFRPEIQSSEGGERILRNFLFKICGLTAEWNMASFIERTIAGLKEKIGDKKVVCALSGGVDSTVTAVLLNRAIGKNLHCIFVDTGLMRHNEAAWVTSMLGESFGLNLQSMDASELFLGRLKDVTDPEQKRKIIGHTFIEIFEQAAAKLGQVDFLAQGTLYPDVIESISATGKGKIVKSHHNVGGLPAHMKMALVEPLRELFKDEVRAVGKELGLPDEFVWRHPFPGPGLAVRVLGDITKERLDLVRKADVIVLEELRASGWYNKVWQGFAVLLPLKTVGLMGDGRSYEHVIALRVVNSLDAMTAKWVELPGDLLNRISSRIIKEVNGINRVVYDISSKPPATIEWE